MEIDEEVRRQTIISVLAVGVFLAALITIGLVYDGADGLSSAGALAVVGALSGFILLMAGVGFVLSRLEASAETETTVTESTENDETTNE